MADFKEFCSEDFEGGIDRGPLMTVLKRICERSQPLFANPLKVKYHGSNPNKLFPGCHAALYIVEARKKYWLGIFPRKKTALCRYLFSINPGFCDLRGKKEINCAVFDHFILDIVRDEIRKYANDFQIKTVNLMHGFKN